MLAASQEAHDDLVGDGWDSSGYTGYIHSSSDLPGLLPLYQLLNPGSNDRLYTINVSERDASVASGWTDQGVIGYVFADAANNRKPLYRAYNASTGQHTFTGEVNDYNGLSSDWTRQGICCYLDSIAPPPAPDGVDVYSDDGSVTVIWSTSTEATNYSVKRSTDPNGSFVTVASNIRPTAGVAVAAAVADDEAPTPAPAPTQPATRIASLSYQDTSVTNDSTYYYLVSAVNASGESRSSRIVSGKPRPQQPSPGSGPGIPFPWQGFVDGVNTRNGNKFTSIPMINWTVRGGVPVNFSLNHNSGGSGNWVSIAPKWITSYSVSLSVPRDGDVYVDFGDGHREHFWASNPFTSSDPAFCGVYHTDTWNNNVLVGNLIHYYGWTNSGQEVLGVHFQLTTKDNLVYDFDNVPQMYNNNSRAGLLSIRDSNNNGIFLTYVPDGQPGRISTITDSTRRGRKITLDYDGASSRLLKVTDPDYNKWTLEYWPNGDLRQINYPPVRTYVNYPSIITYAYHVIYGYNSSHDITGVTDPLYHTSTFEYNSDNSLAWEKDPHENTTNFGYTSTTTTITDPNGHSVVHTYDSNGRLAKTRDALNYEEIYGYDSHNNRNKLTDRRGSVWNYRYNDAGDMLTSKNPFGFTMTYTYEDNDTLTQKFPDGQTTVFKYDHHNLLRVQKRNPGNKILSTTTYGYVSSGNLGLPISEKDGLGHVTYFGYDPDGNRDWVKDANGNITTSVFTTLGKKWKVTDALLHTTRFDYDEWGRLILVTPPTGAPTATAYDGNSNVISVTAPNGHVRSNDYDSDNRLVRSTNGHNDIITYAYDGNFQKGLVSSKTDNNGHTTTYAYTDRNEKRAVLYADGNVERWTYDPNGNMDSHTDANGAVIRSFYDSDNSLRQITYPNNVSTTFGYDPNGRRNDMRDGTGHTLWQYDGADRLTNIDSPQGSLLYDYDAANRRKFVQVFGTRNWAYGYDSGNRMTSLTNPFGETTRFGYDEVNHLTTQKNSTNLITRYDYDNNSRVTSVKWGPVEDPTRNGFQSYEYGDNVNLTKRTDSDGSITTYGYDGADQLIDEVRQGGPAALLPFHVAYTYDHNGNRMTRTLNGATDTYVYYPNSDRLQHTNSKSYAYDSNGNVTAVAGGGQTTTLSYTPDNRVASIRYPSGASNAFYYNGLGLRVFKQDSRGGVSYLCDGSDPGSSVLWDSTAIYTPGISERRGGVSSFYQSDVLGSTRALHNGTWYTTDAFVYDGFGNTLSRSGNTPTPFAFVGKQGYQTDNDSDLQLLGNRYYDPSIGRFLSPDPQQDGNNWYDYAGNNPLMGTDATGLEVDQWGAYLLDRWLLGSGRAVTMNGGDTVYNPILRKESMPIGQYLMANGAFTADIADYLRQMGQDLPRGGTMFFNSQHHGEVVGKTGDEFEITGYNYLHGSKGYRGDLGMQGVIAHTMNGSWYFAVNYTWNDVIAPKGTIAGDVTLSKIADFMLFGKPQDYPITIRWGAESFYGPGKGNRSGWPFGGK